MNPAYCLSRTLKVGLTSSLYILLNLLWSNIEAQSLSTLLGYSDKDRLLIIHSDDLGVSHAENAASLEAMQYGIVNSGSIMVPTPWFYEIAKIYQSHPQLDLGIHLTLTSEWNDYKWGPVAPIDNVRSLVNKYGYFYSTVDSFNMYAKPSEVLIELTAQIDKCLSLGLDITHLDGHMGAIFSTPSNMEIYLQLAKKYKLPVMYHPLMNAMFTAKGKTFSYAYPVDDIIGAPTTAYPDGMAKYYQNAMDSLKSGISIFIIHTAYDNAEIQAVCTGHEHYGSKWREIDFKYFTSAGAKEDLERNGIISITWRDIRDKVIRKIKK
jgi:chitin disaccharide deacetylase